MSFLVVAFLCILFNVKSSENHSTLPAKYVDHKSDQAVDNGRFVSQQRSKYMHSGIIGKINPNAFFKSMKVDDHALNEQLNNYEDALRRLSVHPDGMRGMMSAKMRFFSERLASGTEAEKKEALAIFELAASDVIREEWEKKYGEDRLIDQYPEYAVQIDVAKHIFEYTTTLYIARHALDVVDSNEKIKLVEKFDHSFVYQILSNYESNDALSGEEVRLNTLNYYTYRLFEDETYSWWLKEFKEVDLGKAFLKNSSTVDKFKPQIIYK